MKKRPKTAARAKRKTAATKQAAAKKQAKKHAAAGKRPAAKTLPAAKRRTLAKQRPIAKSSASATDSPSRLIDARIRDLGDWRGTTLAHVRALLRQAVPDVVEEWKWRGVPVWYHHGQLCTGETYKSVVKLTFLKGASLPDPARLFNSSLEGNARRAIDIREGESIDADAFKALIRAAAALNGAKS
jgi:hypothetical protein